MNREKELEILLEGCNTEVFIRCDNCFYSVSLYETDSYDAVEEFYDKGWRATAMNIYCPSCAKKKLKRKN